MSQQHREVGISNKYLKSKIEANIEVKIFIYKILACKSDYFVVVQSQIEIFGRGNKRESK